MSSPPGQDNRASCWVIVTGRSWGAVYEVGHTPENQVGTLLRPLAPIEEIGRYARGREGLREMMSRLYFLRRDPADSVVTIEAMSDWWWENEVAHAKPAKNSPI